MDVRQSNSQSWDTFSNDFDLKKVKQDLLSSNKKQIMEAVEKIKILTSSDNFVVDFIKADICEFLCDAVTLSDGAVIENIYGCLKVMTKHQQFYSHNHSCFTIESIIRCLYFLLKNPCNSAIVGQSLDLLTIITQGHCNYNITPEKKTMRNLLEVLMLLTKSEEPTNENAFRIGSLLVNIISLNTSKKYNECREFLLTCVSRWLAAVTRVFQAVHPPKEKLILVCCKLSHSFLGCVLTECTLSQESDDVKNTVILQIRNFLVKTGVPYFDSQVLGCQNDFTHLELYFETLLFFCNNGTQSHKKYLMHELSESGFIQLIAKIMSSYQHKFCQNLQKLCVVVLFQIIMVLSEDVFHIPDVWPGSQLDFHDLTQEGISQLSTDSSQWLDVLASPYSSYSSKLVLLLYLYFYTITSKRDTSLDNIYPSLLNFINHSFDLNSPVLVIKTLWFVFVMSDLSNKRYSSLITENEPADKVIRALQAQKDLSLVYTHHPSILYWTFSSKIPTSIQFQIVRLWLQNKTSDCRVLEELIDKSSEVRYTLLTILSKEQGNVLNLAFSSLKSVLTDKQNPDLASNIWYLLPKALAEYSADSTSARNVDYFIELSSLEPPTSLDSSKILRTALLLPDIIFSSSLISIVPSLKIIYHLLQLGHQIQDSRVMSTFIRSQDFVQKLLDRLFTNTSEMSLYVIKIITHLWKYGKEFENTDFSDKIPLSKEAVIQVLETDSMEVLPCSMEFLLEVLATRFCSPVFQIQKIDVDFVEILFFQLQNISMKSSPEICRKTWACLKMFLEIGAGDFHMELATNPLFHEIIMFHLPNLNDFPEMEDFLIVWMDQNNKINNSSCFERRIFGGFYLETVEAIVRNGKQIQQLHEKIIQAGVFLQ